MISACETGDTGDLRKETAPGMEFLCGAVDGHIHACAHLNPRSVTVFEAAKAARTAGMAAIGDGAMAGSVLLPPGLGRRSVGRFPTGPEASPLAAAAPPLLGCVLPPPNPPWTEAFP